MIKKCKQGYMLIMSGKVEGIYKTQAQARQQLALAEYFQSVKVLTLNT